VSEAENFAFIIKTSSNEKKMKKQHKVFSIDGKMYIEAEVDAHVGTQLGLVTVLGLSVLSLNMIMSKWLETDKSYSCCGSLFSTKTLISDDYTIGRTWNHPFGMVQASPNHQSIHWWNTPEGKGSTCSGSSRYRQFSGFRQLDQPF